MQAPTAEQLALDPVAETARIGAALRTQLSEVLHRRGLIVAMSGGVDSSVCAGLAVSALGPARVFGVFMPERDSDPESLGLAREWAEKLGIEYTVEDIAPTLEAVGCYQRRDDAIRRVVPEYGPGWKSKIVLPSNRLETDKLNTFTLVVQTPDGELRRHRLPPAEYRVIIAATGFKQRVRKMLEYYHADRLHYAVVGTPNRLEYDQGFFVKGGDGLADVKPIAHLFKTQVYRLAAHLGVPSGVTARPPTTDTFSLPQTQEEFHYSLPTAMMDRVLHAKNSGLDVDAAAELLGLQPEQVARTYKDIDQKRMTTRYLHQTPLLVDPVTEIHLAETI